MKKINVFVGHTYTGDISMPHRAIIRCAESLTEFLQNDKDVFNVYTNQPDVVNLLAYFDTKGVECEFEFYLYNKRTEVDLIFKEFNKAYDISAQYCLTDKNI